jgi:hypothetical protein
MRLKPTWGYKPRVPSSNYFQRGLPSAYMFKRTFDYEKPDKTSQLTCHAGRTPGLGWV